MVEKKTSGNRVKPKSDETDAVPDTTPDVGGLTASLDALMEIAESHEKRNKGDVVHLSTRQSKGRGESAATSRKAAKKPSARRRTPTRKTSTAPRKKAEPEAVETSKKSDPESLGIVELLGALKSDIDSLRKDNEEFKARLMGASLVGTSSSADESTDVRGLLEALKADISNLRHENDLLRNQTMGKKPDETVVTEADQELYRMLAELKSDIVSLRTENEELRRKNIIEPTVAAGTKTDEVAMLLQELKGDINELKHENESLRLENLTARDGARIESLVGQHGAYRNTGNGVFSSLLKGLGVFVLIAGAAGGGYYLAKTQGGEQGGRQGGLSSARETASNIARKSLDLRPVSKPGAVQPTASKVEQTKTLPVIKAPVEKAPVEKAPVRKAPVRKVVSKVAPVAKSSADTKGRPAVKSISADVETAMMTRADGLMEARDLGAARMVFVYLARHGSAGAMTRLAQTYDPEFLVKNRFDKAGNGDLTRAIRLYGAAATMGDKQAARRLNELQ